MQAVDVILRALTGQPSVTPNSTISELTPLLNLGMSLSVETKSVVKTESLVQT